MSVSEREPGRELEGGESERLAAAVAGQLPSSLVSLFEPRFVRSHTLFDEFVHRLTLHVFREAGLVKAVSDWGGVADVIARAGLEPHRSEVPVSWMLHHLAARGAVEREDSLGGSRFRADGGVPVLDPAVVKAEQGRHDPACLPSYVLAETAAGDYPAFLRGERSGDEILLAPARLPLWIGYFSNDNVLYAVNNWVGAAAVETWMGRGRGAILELGGGLASGACAVLERLTAAGRLEDVRAYHFTELVPAFLRRAQRLLQDRFGATPFLTFGALDMNRSFVEQGVARETVSIVYAVNTLHVAHDLTFTLGEVRRVLAPGGQLIISECVRPRPGQTLYPEYVFNLLETFRAPRLDPPCRPNGGFLTPEQWTAALEANGFVDVRVFPDIARIRAVFPTFYVAAIGAARGG